MGSISVLFRTPWKLVSSCSLPNGSRILLCQILNLFTSRLCLTLLPIPEPRCHGTSLAPPASAGAKEVLCGRSRTGGPCSTAPITLALVQGADCHPPVSTKCAMLAQPCCTDAAQSIGLCCPLSFQSSLSSSDLKESKAPEGRCTISPLFLVSPLMVCVCAHSQGMLNGLFSVLPFHSMCSSSN